jgi:hypothetical protein
MKIGHLFESALLGCFCAVHIKGFRPIARVSLLRSSRRIHNKGTMDQDSQPHKKGKGQAGSVKRGNSLHDGLVTCAHSITSLSASSSSEGTCMQL